MNAKQLTVAVLMGGLSTEREVSLRSGAAVVRALEGKGLRIAPVDVRSRGLELPLDTDVAFIALHGTFGEDGEVQQWLEDRGVPYTGSGVEASRLAFDKSAAKKAFVAGGVPTPRSVTLSGWSAETLRVSELALPLVVKPARQGSSVGVQIVTEYADLERACRQAWAYDRQVVIEEYIRGREMTVGIFDQAALPVVEVRTSRNFFDYEAKYTPGETEYLAPAPLPAVDAARVQEVALRAHECLGCRDYSRVDVMMDDAGRLSVLEVNTIPGFTETSLVPKAARVAGLKFATLCLCLVRMALARSQPHATMVDWLHETMATGTREAVGAGRV